MTTELKDFLIEELGQILQGINDFKEDLTGDKDRVVSILLLSKTKLETSIPLDIKEVYSIKSSCAASLPIMYEDYLKSANRIELADEVVSKISNPIIMELGRQASTEAKEGLNAMLQRISNYEQIIATL